MSGRTIFITGVSSGIGAALAEFYLKQDFRVLAVNRREPEFLQKYPNFQFAVLDLTQHDKFDAALNQLFSGIRRLDVAVLNAGIVGRIADMKDTSITQLKQLMDMNVWANKLLLDWLFNHSSDTSPSITSQKMTIKQVVTISSGAAVNGNRGWNGYSISKAALNMLTQLYSAENPGTHFTALAPGLVDTAMQDYLCGLADSRFPSLEVLQSRRGTESMPTPEKLTPKLASIIDAIPGWSPTGSFVDIRNLPEAAINQGNFVLD